LLALETVHPYDKDSYLIAGTRASKFIRFLHLIVSSKASVTEGERMHFILSKDFNSFLHPLFLPSSCENALGVGKAA